MKNENIFELCSAVLTKLGFGNETLMSLVNKWQFFIEECQEGYDWDYSEYRNEIRVRGLIEELLSDPRISNADELAHLFSEVFRLDEKFKCLLQSGVSMLEGGHWWEQGVLIRAGDEYCHYMKSAYGIYVESVEG
ncbi:MULTISPECIES: hypothetical protein [Pseudomonas]|uniref:Uncharacterized protein n=1 Tax=Pseudomonas fluorescens TaxID=294 RepID=A0A0N9WFL0_PSEFL|nr:MULTISPECIES: hypothetical protein [Pseudomonas]ALI06683.1 hypothetical protein AO356_07675 [Pseudomonas fluorescens]